MLIINSIHLLVRVVLIPLDTDEMRSLYYKEKALMGNIKMKIEKDLPL